MATVTVRGRAVADVQPDRVRLRAAAVLDARARVLDYAGAAGLRLGALEQIAEPDAGRPGEPQRAVMLSFAEQAAAAPGPVLELRPEPVQVRAEVVVRYALLPGSQG